MDYQLSHATLFSCCRLNDRSYYSIIQRSCQGVCEIFKLPSKRAVKKKGRNHSPSSVVLSVSGMCRCLRSKGSVHIKSLSDHMRVNRNRGTGSPGGWRRTAATKGRGTRHGVAKKRRRQIATAQTVDKGTSAVFFCKRGKIQKEKRGERRIYTVTNTGGERNVETEA